MPCDDIKHVIDLCKQHEIKVSQSDLIRAACNDCEEVEVCSSTNSVEYEKRESKSNPPQKTN